MTRPPPSGFAVTRRERPREAEDFQRFIEERKDENDAVRILY